MRFISQDVIKTCPLVFEVLKMCENRQFDRNCYIFTCDSHILSFDEMQGLTACKWALMILMQYKIKNAHHRSLQWQTQWASFCNSFVKAKHFL